MFIILMVNIFHSEHHIILPIYSQVTTKCFLLLHSSMPPSIHLAVGEFVMSDLLSTNEILFNRMLCLMIRSRWVALLKIKSYCLHYKITKFICWLEIGCKWLFYHVLFLFFVVITTLDHPIPPGKLWERVNEGS